MVINVQRTKGKWNFYERGVVIYYKYEHLTHLFSQTGLVTLHGARMGKWPGPPTSDQNELL